MRKLKLCHKKLTFTEAGFTYCIRHNLNYDTFIDDIFMKFDSDSSEGIEIDNLCDDLRCYRYFETYVPKTITDDEYELCVDKFGEQ